MYLRYRKAAQAAAGRTFAVLLAASLAFGAVAPAVAAEPAEQAAASVEEQGELVQEPTAGEAAGAPAANEAEPTAASTPDEGSQPNPALDAATTPAPVPTSEPSLPQDESRNSDEGSGESVPAEKASDPEAKATSEKLASSDSSSDKQEASGTGPAKKSSRSTQATSASGTLDWGIRSSFRKYVGAIGVITVTAPATGGVDGIKFKAASAQSQLNAGVIAFEGAVRFVAHGGTLDLSFADPQVTLTSKRTATISAVVTANDVSGIKVVDGKRVVLSEFSFSEDVEIVDGVLKTSSGPGVLLKSGEIAFGGFYSADAELDKVVLDVSGLDANLEPTEPSTPTTPTAPSTPTEPSTPTTPSDSKQVGSLVWGFKESFRKYITGPIAQGSVTMSGGASNNGSAYEFAQTKSSVKNGKGSVQFAGGVRFEGHHGELDSKFTSPKVTLTSATAGKISFTATTIHYTDPTRKFSNESIVVATFKDAKKSTNKDGSVTYTAKKVYLTKDGAASFSDFYEAGDLVDSVTFTVGANSSEDGGTSGSDNSSANLAKAKKAGTYKNAKVNKSTLAPGGQFTITAGGFGGNTKGIELAVYSKKTVIKSNIKAGTDGTVSVTASLPKDLSVGTHTLSLEAPNGVIQQVKIKVTALATQTVAQEAAQAEQGPTCVAQAVSGATASWGFKASYVAYVGRLSDGNISTSGVSRSGNSFTWGSGTGKYNTETGMGTIRFGGSVRFTGHSNVMDSTFSGLTVQISGNTGYLYTNVKAKGLENDGLTKNGALLGTIYLSGKKSVAGSTLSISGASVTLTAEGAEAFGGFYNAGDALDPITLKVPLGAETSCDNGTGATLAKFGGKGGLANTGADGMATATAAAIFMMLAGAVSLTVARRQRVRATVRASR